MRALVRERCQNSIIFELQLRLWLTLRFRLRHWPGHSVSSWRQKSVKSVNSMNLRFQFLVKLVAFSTYLLGKMWCIEIIERIMNNHVRIILATMTTTSRWLKSSLICTFLTFIIIDSSGISWVLCTKKSSKNSCVATYGASAMLIQADAWQHIAQHFFEKFLALLSPTFFVASIWFRQLEIYFVKRGGKNINCNTLIPPHYTKFHPGWEYQRDYEL